MKRIVCLGCMLWIAVSGISQSTSLCISTDKTISLVFPFPILHVDRGTKDVLVLPIKEADNILLVKAASKDFLETNLSVVTGDGNVYSFIVCYNRNPDNWVIHLPSQSNASIQTYANGILDNPAIMRGIRNRKWDMQCRVNGIYIKDNVMFFQLTLENESQIDYTIDFVRFYVRDRKKGKRTAIQENELKPLYVAGNLSQVKANSSSALVVALDKFTIPDAKYLAIEMNEKNGGRNLLLKLSNKKIIKARMLPDLK